MTEQQQRAAVVAEARTWLPIRKAGGVWTPTPFVHGARVKHAGADCETFICEVFAASGVFAAQGIPYVPAQWFLNTKEELYLNYLSKYATEYSGTTPQPGDVICVKHRWVYSHGAIVLAWPRVIHCYPPCVMESNARLNAAFANRALKFFNPWQKPAAPAAASPVAKP